VRPVIASDQAKDPSKERRDHAVWRDNGLVTVSGGKLTTFRLIALDAINAAEEYLGNLEVREGDDTIFAASVISSDELNTVNREWAQRLIGRYGNHAKTILAKANENEVDLIADTQFCLAECRWAARNESVVHLDDLLLRRTRIGALMKNGAEALFPAIENICAEELHWDAARWQFELSRYRDIWTQHYYLPAS
jgi:glycerol-3-phosphate dehydrogenase